MAEAICQNNSRSGLYVCPKRGTIEAMMKPELNPNSIGAFCPEMQSAGQWAVLSITLDPEKISYRHRNEFEFIKI
jgi:hypothetical protein